MVDGDGGDGDAAFEAPLRRERVRALPPGDITPYVEALRDAIVVLAPAGDDLETFRFWEALEAGAIPVLVAPVDPDVDFIRQDVFGAEAMYELKSESCCGVAVSQSYLGGAREVLGVGRERRTRTFAKRG